MLIHNATVITFDDTNSVLPDGGVYLRGDEIAAVGQSRQLLSRFPDAERWDAQGKLLMPGMICAHTHFYGAFARGMYIPGQPAKDFPEILQKLWWPLDRSLDLGGVQSSAEVCLVDAIRNGTTTLIDHHASQNAIDGSLDAIATAVEASGLRSALCYEVTDRDGPAATQAGIRENVRFAAALRGSPLAARVAATFGLHASMTLSDETLEACRAESDRFHVHAAEHPADAWNSLGRSGKTHGRKIAQLWHHRGRKYLCPLHTYRRLGDGPPQGDGDVRIASAPLEYEQRGGRGQCPGDAAGRDGRRTRQ